MELSIRFILFNAQQMLKSFSHIARVRELNLCHVLSGFRSLHSSFPVKSASDVNANDSSPKEEVNFYRQIDYFYDKAAVLIEDKLAQVHNFEYFNFSF